MLKYKLSQEAFQEYIKCTKGNENLSFELAEKKLNRNIYLSKLIHKNDYIEKFQYGSLIIKVGFGEIMSVYKAKCYYSHVKSKKKYRLNDRLNIPV